MIDILGARKGERVHSPVLSHDYAIMAFWAARWERGAARLSQRFWLQVEVGVSSAEAPVQLRVRRGMQIHVFTSVTSEVSSTGDSSQLTFIGQAA